jgi:hypothetical protein
VRLPATTRAERGSVCWRRTYCSRFVHLDTTLLPDRSRNWVFDLRRRRNAARQERNTIMEPLMPAAAQATDMVRVGRSGLYRLIAARRRESIKIGRAARIGRLDPPRRSQECGVVHVAGGLALRS